ncbi:hypothetical protein DSO57_1037128 [Entomophthora muscae]|uniref:Uncharacterized protein n=1 Tax=Entomophthora muscae TaxID=34485 RepID=A0ACC2RDQ8_9FUNG|nr:hypothetical protein DSO57_1037128 [Entomophthora muscae]
MPVTPNPMAASSPDHTGKLFGIVYITLTGVIDTIILAAGPWSWVGKSVSYLFKLAPLLWWALPAKNPAQVTPGNDGPAAQDWIPNMGYCPPIYDVTLERSPNTLTGFTSIFIDTQQPHLNRPHPLVHTVLCTSRAHGQTFTVEGPEKVTVCYYLHQV